MVRLIWLLIASVVTLVLASPVDAAPISVVNDSNPSSLLAVLLGDISGLTGITATLSADERASGIFTGGPLAFDNGVVLSTGAAVDIEGTNRYWGSIDDPPGTGDASTDLNTLEALPIDDFTRLTISFTSDATVGALAFNYVFASEELHPTEVLYNDRLTISLNGVNLARLACGSPVDVAGLIACPNERRTTTPDSNEMTLNGYSSPLSLLAALTPGNHVLEIVISDAEDELLDSAVFLQAESFRSVPVPEPSSLLLFGSGALGLLARRRARHAS